MKAIATAAIALLLSITTVAETIYFTTGEAVHDAQILGAKDGILVYAIEGRQYRRRIAEVRDISKAAERFDPDNNVKLISFNRVEESEGDHRLNLAISNTPTRMHEPFVRTFVLERDDRGQRSVRIYQNNRKTVDPSSIADLPMIDGASYADIHFLVPGNNPLAWRIEVWIDGTLRVARNLGAPDAQENWWSLAEKPRRSTLSQVEKPEEPEEEIKDDEPEKPKISAAIVRTSIKPVLGSKEGATFSVQYQLKSNSVTTAELPEVTLHYVTEDANERRSVRSATLKDQDDLAVDLRGGGAVNRTVTYTFPANVQINSANRHLNNTEGTVGLSFWRLHITYDDTILAVKQGGDNRIGRSLPDDWWK